MRRFSTGGSRDNRGIAECCDSLRPLLAPVLKRPRLFRCVSFEQEVAEIAEKSQGVVTLSLRPLLAPVLKRLRLFRYVSFEQEVAEITEESQGVVILRALCLLLFSNCIDCSDMSVLNRR